MLASVAKINPPAWMKANETGAVLAALQAGRRKISALFVGGCVRNAVLGLPVTDIDIATALTPEETIEALEKAGIKAISTGIEHGTVTAVRSKKTFEITTLRRDVATDGRRAVVAFTTDWREDAQRRDFTMNTLLADPEGNIYDPLGQGWGDLQERRVVFVGDPAQRIAEDYLRILRFFRFWAVYGAGDPDPAALDACRAAAGKIAKLSRERTTQEFLRILALENPVPVLDVMFGNGVLSDLPAAGYDEAVMLALCGLQEKYDAIDVVPRLGVLAAFMPSHLEELENFLVLSNDQKKEFETTLDQIAAIDEMDKMTVKRLVYRHGNSYTLQIVLMFMAWQEREYPSLVDLVKTWEAPAFPLTGDDVKKAGIGQGPKVGRLLSEVEQWWIGQDFQPARWACLAKLESLLNNK